MLKQSTVFDKEVFKIGTFVKVVTLDTDDFMLYPHDGMVKSCTSDTLEVMGLTEDVRISVEDVEKGMVGIMVVGVNDMDFASMLHDMIEENAWRDDETKEIKGYPKLHRKLENFMEEYKKDEKEQQLKLEAEVALNEKE